MPQHSNFLIYWVGRVCNICIIIIIIIIIIISSSSSSSSIHLDARQWQMPSTVLPIHSMGVRCLLMIG